ncbi:MAG: uracil phosphoribosyltransferase [Chloroflexota bacterium]
MVHESKHPLILHKLSMLRSVDTKPQQFRELAHELAIMLGYESMQNLNVVEKEVVTPMGAMTGHELQIRIGLVPILRAGLGMVDGLLEIFPAATTWHLGMYRNEETLQPVWYYNKLPADPQVDVALVLDPMLATGGSAIATVTEIKRWGVKDIRFLGLIAAPEGIEALQKVHPDVPVHVAAIDSHLNDIGYIVPGLGDAGDRLFGTIE